MKKLGLLFVLVMSAAMIMPSCSTRDAVGRGVSEKTIKREVRQLKREGWKVSAGLLPMEMQLRESYQMQMEKDDKGYDKYVMGDAQSVAENYNAALFDATNNAKRDLVRKIESNITELIKSKLGNKQLSNEEAVSLSESVAASVELVAQKLGRIMIPVRMYRILSNGNVEVRTIVFYSHDMAFDLMKETMREDLEKKADELSRKLDEILGL